MSLQPSRGHQEPNKSNGIPEFDHRGLLPPGIHQADWAEVVDRFGWTEQRREHLKGLRNACQHLRQAGVKSLYLDGGFVSSKPDPDDYDVCWNMQADGIDVSGLPTCLSPRTQSPPEQKHQFSGEFRALQFLEIFQTDYDGQRKGIVLLDLSTVE